MRHLEILPRDAPADFKSTLMGCQQEHVHGRMVPVEAESRLQSEREREREREEREDCRELV